MALTPSLSLSGVSLTLGGAQVLQGIDLPLRKGEIVVLLGPSGCGKTSLLRLMAGLVPPDAGEVRLNGAAPEPGRGSAMVFQSYRLLPWKSVAANVGFALPHLSPEARQARVAAMLALVGLTRFADAWPGSLSGGMKQRVALARALAPQPDFLLMDEPFAALDAQARELMQVELRRLVGGPNAPGVVFVTHSVDEALILGDRILMLSPRPGRIVMRIDTPFSGADDPRDHRDYPELRRRLWDRLRDAVLEDPNSDFYRAE